MAEHVRPLTGLFCREIGLFCGDIRLFCKDVRDKMTWEWYRLWTFIQGRCNTLRHTATYCNALWRTATHCSTLQHTATHGNTLQHTAKHCVSTQVRMAVISSLLLHSVAGTYPKQILWCFLIHTCAMTQSQWSQRLTYVTWWPKTFSSAFLLVLYYIQNQKNMS